MLRHRRIGVLVALFLSIWTAVAAAAPFAYVTNSGSGAVSVVDTATNTVVATIPTMGFLPWGVAISPDGSRVYVANLVSNSVTVLSGTTHSFIRTVAVGRFPFGVAVHPNSSTVFVTNSGNGTMSVINAETFDVTSVSVISPRGVAITPDGAKVFVANNFVETVTVFDGATHSILGTVPVGAGPIGVAASPDGSKVVVTNESDGTVTIINAGTHAVLGTVTVGQGPFGVAISGDSRRAYVANSRSDSISVVDLIGRTIVAEVQVGIFPMGVSVIGNRVYVASRDSNRVDIIDAATNTSAGTLPVGVSPVAFGTFIQPMTVLAVDIDIMPGGNPNTISLKAKGTLPVAILSSESFDATTVDPLTVKLAGASVAMRGNGKPMASFEDVNEDGRLDLVVHVRREELQLSAGDTVAVFEGRTEDGVAITGSDSVKVVP